MFDIFMDALIDCAKMIPLLLIIYIGIEFLEHKFDNKINKAVKNSGKMGPIIASFFGCIPQCGFSVMGSALYTKKVITVGTLLAVYISTSDEAIPIILAQPEKANIILPLLVSKVVIAIVAGYMVDFIFRNSVPMSAENELSAAIEITNDFSNEKSHNCHDHCCNKGTNNYTNLKNIIYDSFIHTIKVFIFIFIVTLVINYIIFRIGEENLGSFLLQNSIFQPILASFIGLIPNCAASVAITEIFLKGGLSFGSTIAGLSAGAGLGIIVLLRENKDIKNTLKIVGMLICISSIAGILIQSIYG